MVARHYLKCFVGREIVGFTIHISYS